MAEERDVRDERSRLAPEEPRHRKRVGAKPYALRVTESYEPAIAGWLGKPWVRVCRYATERARDDAVRRYATRNDVIGRHRTVYVVEKLDE